MWIVEVEINSCISCRKWGPFTHHETAEKLVVALGTRSNVDGAKIVKERKMTCDELCERLDVSQHISHVMRNPSPKEEADNG